MLEDKENKVQEIENFFTKAKKNLKISVLLKDFGENSVKILESVKVDIIYLSEINSNLSSACEIMKEFIDCYLIIKKNESKNTQLKIDNNKLLQIEEVCQFIF